MKTFILIGFFVAIHPNIFSQVYISGKVVDTNDESMPGVTICLGNSKDCQVSDINGEFRILKPQEKGMTMSISFIGYETVKIDNVDSIFHPITITMKESPWIETYPHRVYFDFFVLLSMQFDFFSPSFSNFGSILGKENVDNLNKLNMSGGLECAVLYKRFHFALNFGGIDHSLKLDSINAGKGDYRTFLLGTHFGYNIVNSKGFIITPKIGIKWYRYRMTNYDRENRIPMEQYITERDLDVRFNHLVGFTGLNCTYIFNNYYHPIAIGFYGGYAFKLNDKTWVYSRHNRLTTDYKIDFSNFNFGISMSYIFN